ncbi:MAG: alpha/beta hydrolase [Candidatus Marinimicrobia bacterium]|nr:alpha/beta hydrolase [Candidatus Neomarinimicrobiota bacterium]
MINILHFISFLILIPLCSLTIMISCAESLSDPEEEIVKATPLVPQGISKFEFDNYPTLSNAPLSVHTYLADSTIKNIPIVFIMHGANRNAYDYCIDWVEPARKHNFLIVCPEIDVNRYPGSAGYNLGGMYDASTLLDSTQWTFSFIEPIFEYLIENEVSNVETYGIYGHSAGSQFVHRFALFTHPTHAKIFIAANAGWYTMTDFTEEFPYGFQNSPMMEENIKEKFKLDLVILLGENDTDPNASSLRKTEEAMRQGKHRFERGNSFYTKAKSMADSLETEFKWTKVTIPEVGHSNFGMAPTGAELFYDALKN